MRFHTYAFVPLIAFCLLRAQEPAPPSTQQNPFEAVTETPQSPPAKVSGPAIVAIEFRGAKRISQTTLRVLVNSRAGGAYDPESLQRDAQALRNTGRFSDVVWETEQSRSGPIVRFVLVERPLIETIEYHGDDSVTLAEISERFAQRKIRLKPESLYHEEDLSGARQRRSRSL